MTLEDKELLLKDLCARLSYGVKVQGNFKWGFDGQIMDDMRESVLDIETLEWLMNGIEVRPYLRPISSMTEEEHTYWDYVYSDSGLGITEGLISECVDWLNAHHFDYRGLIEKGLALEALEGMYNT